MGRGARRSVALGSNRKGRGEAGGRTSFLALTILRGWDHDAKAAAAGDVEDAAGSD